MPTTRNDGGALERYRLDEAHRRWQTKRLAETVAEQPARPYGTPPKKKYPRVTLYAGTDPDRAAERIRSRLGDDFAEALARALAR